jgi:hypothetical protein
VLRLAPLSGIGFGEPAVLYGVWLHSDWKGTAEDLWHIERLAHWPDLVIYSIRGNGIDRRDLLAAGTRTRRQAATAG